MSGNKDAIYYIIVYFAFVLCAIIVAYFVGRELAIQDMERIKNTKEEIPGVCVEEKHFVLWKHDLNRKYQVLESGCVRREIIK